MWFLWEDVCLYFNVWWFGWEIAWKGGRRTLVHTNHMLPGSSRTNHHRQQSGGLIKEGVGQTIATGVTQNGSKVYSVLGIV